MTPPCRRHDNSVKPRTLRRRAAAANAARVSETQQHCGLVAVVGAPNAGKSTLVNRMVGQKVAIVSPKAQTTRTRLLGVAIEGDTQVLLVDTPGIFVPKRRFDRAMVAAAWNGAEGADVIALVVDAKGGLGDKVTDIVARLKDRPEPKHLVLNKVDLAAKDKLLLHAERLNGLCDFAETWFVSAETGDGVDELKSAFARLMPAGPWHYPEDQVSDATERALAGEIVARTALPPAPRGTALCLRGRDREVCRTPRRIGRDPPADHGRTPDPARDRARQGRATDQGDRRKAPAPN